MRNKEVITFREEATSVVADGSSILIELKLRNVDFSGRRKPEYRVKRGKNKQLTRGFRFNTKLIISEPTLLPKFHEEGGTLASANVIWLML